MGMENIASKPLFWRVKTLLSLGTDNIHELALTAAGTLTSFRLLLGRCLLALRESKGYKEFGCSSEIHYAAQILGVGEREARECRRVARDVEPLGSLTLAAERGEITWSKLREIVRKASPETESYWLKLAGRYNARQIQELVRRTPVGSFPGEVFEEEELSSTELRCPLNPRVFRMLSEARRLYSIEQDEAVTNADIIEATLASYIAGRPVDKEVLEQARDEADKDLQAAEARLLPLVDEARELAEDMGLLGDAAEMEACAEGDEGSTVQEIMALALGAEPMEPPAVRHTCVAGNRKPPSGRPLPNAPWTNPRLSFNAQARTATKAQRKEILRRDSWRCSVPGCTHAAYLELHHVKSYAEGGQTRPGNLLTA
jgi:hypothetical protein